MGPPAGRDGDAAAGLREPPRLPADPPELGGLSLAVELLARGRGESALLTYYESVGLGVPWRDAFARAFGRTVEFFYDEVEAFRRTS